MVPVSCHEIRVINNDSLYGTIFLTRIFLTQKISKKSKLVIKKSQIQKLKNVTQIKNTLSNLAPKNLTITNNFDELFMVPLNCILNTV